MDNIAHTLTGAALGEAGLKRFTGLATPALLVAANIPDLDVLGMVFRENLAWRRGWTHGPVALVALPALLAVTLLLFDRWQARRGTRPAQRAPVRFRPLLLICVVGALSHLLLDYLNTYGIRLLMPFSERWFYGDILFIVDPWIWLALGLGVRASRRRARVHDHAHAEGAHRPAVGALLGVAAYCTAMGLLGRGAEDVVRDELRAAGHVPPSRVVASPVFADPLRRAILVETAEGLRFGDIRWSPWPRLELGTLVVDPHMADPAIARAAAQDERFSDYLYWSRFPFAEIEETSAGTRVTINDARYARQVDAGPFSLRVLLP
jgi:inner membrane protein